MEKIILTIPAYDPEGRRIPDGAVHYWNGATPDSVENEKLKRQTKSFDQYRAEIAVRRLADQMYLDNLLNQLVEAKQALSSKSSVDDDIKKMLIDVHAVITKKSIAEDKDLTPKQKRTDLVEQIRAQRMLGID